MPDMRTRTYTCLTSADADADADAHAQMHMHMHMHMHLNCYGTQLVSPLQVPVIISTFDSLSPHLIGGPNKLGTLYA